jgi:hypothetical protein
LSLFLIALALLSLDKVVTALPIRTFVLSQDCNHTPIVSIPVIIMLARRWHHFWHITAIHGRLLYTVLSDFVQETVEQVFLTHISFKDCMSVPSDAWHMKPSSSLSDREMLVLMN